MNRKFDDEYDVDLGTVDDRPDWAITMRESDYLANVLAIQEMQRRNRISQSRKNYMLQETAYKTIHIDYYASGFKQRECGPVGYGCGKMISWADERMIVYICRKRDGRLEKWHICPTCHNKVNQDYP